PSPLDEGDFRRRDLVKDWHAVSDYQESCVVVGSQKSRKWTFDMLEVPDISSTARPSDDKVCSVPEPGITARGESLCVDPCRHDTHVANIVSEPLGEKLVSGHDYIRTSSHGSHVGFTALLHEPDRVVNVQYQRPSQSSFQSEVGLQERPLQPCHAASPATGNSRHAGRQFDGLPHFPDRLANAID